MPDPAPPSIDQLLTHRPWLRNLAGSLARDPNRADDVEQQTWLAALRSPPRAGASERAWLATVLRNWVRRAVRTDTRRRRREVASARPESLPAVDELIAHEEIRRRVAAEVLRLPEPLRTTVLLRFYEGLTVPAVATRMEVPYETARYRLKAALARLSVTLSPDYRTAAVLPAAGLLGRSLRPHQGVLEMKMPLTLKSAAIGAAAAAVVAATVTAALVSPAAKADAPARVDTAALTTRLADAERELARTAAENATLERRLARARRAERPRRTGRSAAPPPAHAEHATPDEMPHAAARIQGRVLDAFGEPIVEFVDGQVLTVDLAVANALTECPGCEATYVAPPSLWTRIDEHLRPTPEEREELSRLIAHRQASHANAVRTVAKRTEAGWDVGSEDDSPTHARAEAIFGDDVRALLGDNRLDNVKDAQLRRFLDPVFAEARLDEARTQMTTGSCTQCHDLAPSGPPR